MADGDPLAVDSVLFRSLLSEGNVEEALELSLSILERSRDLRNRNYEAEAWIRMERALLGACENSEVGPEIRWCVDRLASFSPGSTLHGLALLNLAAWHSNQDEEMMALVSLSDISSSMGFPNEIIGLARLESGRILASMGDLEPAMRHLWMAMRRLKSVEMNSESLVSAMEWLDIALDDVDYDSPTMDQRISEAKPRGDPGMTSAPSNPEDIREVVGSILSSALRDLSGEVRDDLGLVLDASEIIEEPSWREALEERRIEIQDPRLLEALQS